MTRRALWGTPTAPRRELVGSYAVIVFLGLTATVLTNNVLPANPVGPVLYESGLPFLLFYAPGIVAAIGAYLECGVPTCLGIGLLPAALFATMAIGGTVLGVPGVGGGDAPLSAITVAFAMIALVAAGVGCLAGVTARGVVTMVRRYRA